MPAITSNTPDLSQIPAWQYSGQWLAIAGTPAPVSVAAVPPGLPVGSVLGVVTSTGAYVLCDPNVSPPDGSQVPAAILASQAVIGPPAVQPTVWPSGTFSLSRLFYNANWSVPALVAAMKQVGIYARTSAPTPFGI